MAHLRFPARRSIALTVLAAVALVITIGQSPASAAAPVTRPDAYRTPINTKLVVAAPGVLANDTDADGNRLTAGMPSSPRNGNLILSANGGFTYTPKLNFSGTDTFTYMAHDTQSNMVTGYVTITVGSGTSTGATIAISNARVTEPDPGASVNASFRITRSSGSGTASVKYTTVGKTATSGTDFTAVPLTTVSFAAGETSKTVVVKVLGDNLAEVNERFQVKLSAPVNATFADDRATGTILNDD